MADTPEGDLRLYEQAKALRQRHEDDWRKAAAYCLPAEYQSWKTQTGPVQGASPMESVRRVAYDSTGFRSLPKYVSILERLATPQNQKWHTLTPSDENLKKNNRVRDYFQQLTKLLFKYRYDTRARFKKTTGEAYGAMGVYGCGPIFIKERKPSVTSKTYGMSYLAPPLRDIFILTDDEGNLWGVFRRMWLNARQAKDKFGNSKTPLPDTIMAELKKPQPDEGKFFEFVHFCKPKTMAEHDPTALDNRRHPIVARYLSVEGKQYVGDEEGFQSMPYKTPRTFTVSGDPYGYSPAVLALASLGGASQIKKTNLKYGNLIVAPPLFTYDDGVMNGGIDFRPQAINPGYVGPKGEKLAVPMQLGNYQVGDKLLEDERRDIEDSFFVTLFQILTDTPEMTATEVIERVAEKASLLSPTMGALQSEMLGPMIERELDVLVEIGKFPPPPPELVEAQGEYEVTYTSPMAKAMYMEEVSGFSRSLEMTVGAVQLTGDPSPLDNYNFDVAIPEIADTLNVPARWMNDENQIKAIRDGRAKQAEMQQAVDAAPSVASVAKTMQGGKAAK